MTNKRRNFLIILLVVGLLAASVVTIATRPARLGLDLSGGVELVYQGRPTPQVPEVTPQAVDDAIETIRKRTDALGVSEPEIQRAGADQISIGLPDVKNADRAIEQVGTTAQLQFYDWEPNVFGDPNRTIPSLFEAVSRAARAKPRAEATDIPPGGPEPSVTQRFGGDQAKIREFYDRQNDTGGDKYYLFGPGRIPRPLTSTGESVELGITGARPVTPAGSCQELLADFEDRTQPNTRPGTRKPAPESECKVELLRLGDAGPPAGSRVVRVPRGIVVVKADRPDTLPQNAPFEQYYVLEDDSELSGADIRNPEQNFDQNQPVVTFQFSEKGRRAFAAVTKRIAQRGAEQILPPGTPPRAAFQQFAVTLDNEVVSLATIDFQDLPEGIDGRTGAQIEGIGSLQATQDLAENLRIGALPIELKLISQTQVSATLGQQALEQGLLAGGAGLALTLLFLVAFYRVLGVVAGITLVIYAVLLYALVELIPITLTLPGIAGMILTLGVAADANIVIFERVKEEARGGRSIPSAIASGYGKALKTIIDANVVTIGVAFILFMLATAGVKGFAFTLGVGTLVSLFTAVLATSAILGSISRTRLLASRFALGAGEQRVRWRFDFTGYSKWFFSMSGMILVAGALAIAGFGINFGIDFESGTRIKTPLERPATVEQVRQALPPQFQDAEIQDVDEPELGQNVYQISTETLQPGQEAQVRDSLDRSFGVRRADFSSNSIGPTFGAQIARTALIAIIASLLLISLYIGLRFDAKFAVPVLIALAHDLLITAGVYALTEREVTTSTVAALLTILGFSLYDTIIVFDRIRENVPRMPRATFSQIVNRSMSEVLTRSLVTNLSTLFPILALLFSGGETLTDFAFALLVGVASGTYSSVFIASPVLTAWKEREPVYQRRRQLVMEDHGGVVPAFAEASLGDGAPADERPAAAPRRQPAARAGRPVSGAPEEVTAPTRDVPAPGPPEEVAATGARSATGGPGRVGGARSATRPGPAERPSPSPSGTEAPVGDGAPSRSEAGDGTGARSPSEAGGGDGARSGPQPRADGARQGGGSRSKKSRNRPRKKHGRR